MSRGDEPLAGAGGAGGGVAPDPQGSGVVATPGGSCDGMAPSRPAASEAVPSPCTNICRMNPASGWCEGCLRSIDEIVAWGRLDAAAKRAVWLELDVRRRALEGGPR